MSVVTAPTQCSTYSEPRLTGSVIPEWLHSPHRCLITLQAEFDYLILIYFSFMIGNKNSELVDAYNIINRFHVCINHTLINQKYTVRSGQSRLYKETQCHLVLPFRSAVCHQVSLPLNVIGPYSYNAICIRFASLGRPVFRKPNIFQLTPMAHGL